MDCFGDALSMLPGVSIALAGANQRRFDPCLEEAELVAHRCRIDMVNVPSRPSLTRGS